MYSLPKYILLVGWPKSGKDAVADVIADTIGAFRLDDAKPLREAAPILYGFDRELSYSQEGKDRTVSTPLGDIKVRKALGDLGVALENMYGTGFIPRRAMMTAEAKFATSNMTRAVISSCRRDQARFYPENESICIQIDRPAATPSPHEFDKWDHHYVDCSFANNGSLEDLRQAVRDWLVNFPAHGARDLIAKV